MEDFVQKVTGAGVSSRADEHNYEESLPLERKKLAKSKNLADDDTNLSELLLFTTSGLPMDLVMAAM